MANGQQTQQIVPRPRGRPTTYRPEFVEQGFRLALLGASNEDIAAALNVPPPNVYRWIDTYSDFAEALSRGRIEADGRMAQALYWRGIGARVKQQRPMLVKTPEGGQRIEIVEFIESYPPDTMAMQFWLKNRQPQHWRDKQDIDMSVHGMVGRLPDEDRTGKALAALQALIQGKRPKPTAEPVIESKATDITDKAKA